MTWFDAALYCNELSKLMSIDTVYSYTGVEGTPGRNCTNLENLSADLSIYGYRLPTEAEWEYACRGGTGTDYYWGDAIDSSFCWYDANSLKATKPGGWLNANIFGLLDMSGNVWEWCNDWYGLYDSASVTEPIGADSGKERVLRGGSWMSYARACRSSNRNSALPLYRSKDLGFRTVLTVSSPGKQR
jgi:formylglycine-generating enzyme required for sulfatase activity